MTPKPILPLCVCGDPLCRIPYGICHCGCKATTKLSRCTNKNQGRVFGRHNLYSQGHRRGMKVPASSNEVIYGDGSPYCLIPLLRGLFAKVTPSDYAWLSFWRWRILEGGYVVRSRRRADGPGSTLIYMHCIISGVDGDGIGDHKDRDKFNNRRDNLRFANDSQNCTNRGLASNNTSGYKGVGLRGNRWSATIFLNGKNVHLGFYATKEEAAKVYDRAALKHWGDFAYINFPLERKDA